VLDPVIGVEGVIPKRTDSHAFSVVLGVNELAVSDVDRNVRQTWPEGVLKIEQVPWQQI
jgi:hypothetical protein